MKDFLFSAMLIPDLTAKQILAYRLQSPPHSLDRRVSKGNDKAIPVLLHTIGTGTEQGGAGAELRACEQSHFPWSCIFHQPFSEVPVQADSG